ncbi:hypothetical protein [Alteromonas macleodii]
MSELLEQMKLLNEDHKPDGWPAVRMSEINALVSMIKSQGEQLAKANERVDGLEKALANCADALYESNINHKKAIDKIQAECIDVLFDFAAKRDDSGFAIALYEQPYEIQDAIRIFKQLSKDQSNG